MKRDYEHKPVLLRETVAPLLENRGSVYVDCTLGGGGHLSYLLENKKNATVYAFDQDLHMIEKARTRFREDIERGQLILIHSNYANIRQRLDEKGVAQVDGIMLDAGVSSFQIDMPERGFSFSKSGPLDMRMDQSQPLTAYEVVNHWPREHLEKIFYQYGEEKFSRKIAYRIIERREKAPIDDTATLAGIVEDCLPRASGKSAHPATRVFQAIRIAVNKELESLEAFLKEVPELLRPHGVAAVISFHSLEDRLIKDRFKFLSLHCVCPPQIMSCARCGHPPGILLQKKPIIPTDEEIAVNPRSRSAKLRVFIRNTEPIVSAPNYGGY